MPDASELFLEVLGILELADLLEFIDTYDNIPVFFLRYLFGKLQYFVNVGRACGLLISTELRDCLSFQSRSADV